MSRDAKFLDKARELLRAAKQRARRRKIENNVNDMLEKVPLALQDRHVTASGCRIEEVTTYIEVATDKGCGCVLERQSSTSEHVLMPIARETTTEVWLTEDGQLVWQGRQDGQPFFWTVSVSEIPDTQLLEKIGQDLRKLGQSTGRRR